MSATEIHPANVPVERILQAIGRNILCLSFLESRLKLLVPFLVNPKEQSPKSPWIRYTDMQGKTLGQLAGGLTNSVQCDGYDFPAHLAEIVRKRNELIHQAPGSPLTELWTPLGRIKVLQYLNAQWREIQDFDHVLNPLLMHVLTQLRDITFAGTPEFEEIEEAIRGLEKSLLHNLDLVTGMASKSCDEIGLN
ncbi:MAG: hypothetical protein V4607_16430 [Pseudomonadota bacterium]